MAKTWVIRRRCEMFWDRGRSDEVGGWVPLSGAFRFSDEQREAILADPAEAKTMCAPGEEWVELDDAGRPVEAKAVAVPVREWVQRSPSGLYHMGCGDWSEQLARAMRYTIKRPPSNPANVMVPILVHPDGTVTLDEPAPAVAQPSPYSEDEPIPYKLSGRRVYLASALPNRGRATALAAQLARDGVEIVSTWHDRDDATVEREAAEDRNELAAIAEGCLAEIDSATDLVWMHGHAEGRVGAAVEVGYALARGKRLLLLSLDGSPAPSAFGALGAAVTVSGLYRAVAR